MSFGAAKASNPQSFLCENRVFHQFVKVFSLEVSHYLVSIHTHTHKKSKILTMSLPLNISCAYHAKSINCAPGSNALVYPKEDCFNVEHDGSHNDQNIQIRTGEFHYPGRRDVVMGEIEGV